MTEGFCGCLSVGLERLKLVYVIGLHPDGVILSGPPVRKLEGRDFEEERPMVQQAVKRWLRRRNDMFDRFARDNDKPVSSPVMDGNVTVFL